MAGFWNWLFSTEYWPPRWYCGLWTEGLGWTHIISDLLIFGAYIAIPLILIYFIVKRKDFFSFRTIFLLFALFIVTCGLTHLNSAIIFYYPVYRFDAAVKAVCAIVSWLTVFALIPEVPNFLRLPQMGQMNELLRQNLKEERERLRLAFTASGSGLWDWNVEKDYLFYGHQFASLLNYEIHELPQNFEGFLSLFSPDHRSEIENLRQGKTIDRSVKMITKSGEEKWFKFSCGSDTDLHQKTGRISGSIININDQVLYEKQIESLVETLSQSKRKLETSNKMLEEFSYLSAHDLKQPINGMKIYADILLENNSDDYNDETKDNLRKISKLGDKASHLIDTLLEYSRVTSVNLSKKNVDFHHIINDIIETMEHDIKQNYVDIKILDSFPSIECDEFRIKEVFRNLITNAIKYNDKENKKIEIGCQNSSSGPVFFVKDNGMGINEKDMGKIFKMFQRGSEAQADDDGDGVGLAVVQAIVERHDGAIWVESTKGEGSTFYLSLGHVPETYKKWKNNIT